MARATAPTNRVKLLVALAAALFWFGAAAAQGSSNAADPPAPPRMPHWPNQEPWSVFLVRMEDGKPSCSMRVEFGDRERKEYRVWGIDYGEGTLKLFVGTQLKQDFDTQSVYVDPGYNSYGLTLGTVEVFPNPDGPWYSAYAGFPSSEAVQNDFLSRLTAGTELLFKFWQGRPNVIKIPATVATQITECVAYVKSH